MSRILGSWLACAALAATVAVLSTTACTQTSSSCALARDCDICILDGACAWCFETGQCLVADTHCPGERAITLEECEACLEECLLLDTASAVELCVAETFAPRLSDLLGGEDLTPSPESMLTRDRLP